MKHYVGHSKIFQDGYRCAIKDIIEWLHSRANQMNDPHAKIVLDSAATNLGWDKLGDNKDE